MRVYKNFCPEIIMSINSAGRSSVQSVGPFAIAIWDSLVLILEQQTDIEWLKRLQAIQDISRSHGLTAGILGGFKVARKGAKIGKLSIIPEVHTFHASEASHFSI